MKVSSNGYVTLKTRPCGTQIYLEYRLQSGSLEEISALIESVSETLSPKEVPHSGTPGAAPGAIFVPAWKPGVHYPKYCYPLGTPCLYIAREHVAGQKPRDSDSVLVA